MFKIFNEIIRKIFLKNRSLLILGEKKNLKMGNNVVFDGKVIFDLRAGGQIIIGDNCYFSEGVIVKPFGGIIEIGQSCSFNPYCVLYGHGGLIIGNYVRIATHTVIIPSNHKFDQIDVPIYLQGLNTKGVAIGNDVWIGAGVTILDGSQIDDGAIIAAGAVLNSKVNRMLIYGGVPAKQIGSRIKDEK